MPGGGDSRPDFILSNVICLSGVPDSFRDSLAEEPELVAACVRAMVEAAGSVPVRSRAV